MDPVTHGLIGASVAQVYADKDKIRPAAFIGFASALLADLDVLIHNPNDPLLNVEMHRQFTHSFIFIPVGALIATALLWWFVRKRISLKETYIISLIGYATSGIADTLTSYGTQLLWPFTDERFAWNLISVFDPVFTLGILIAFFFTVWHLNKKANYIGLSWIGFYLIFAVFQQHRAVELATNFADEQGHEVEKLVVKPTIGNQLLWSARFISVDSVFALGIRPGFLKESKVYEGESAQLLDWRNEYQVLEGTTLYKDIERFSVLSNGFLINHPSYPNIIGDARYSMLPTSMEPLWGIEADTTQPHKHLPFQNYRTVDDEVKTGFKKMLFGLEFSSK